MPAHLLEGSPPLGGILLVDKPAGISSHSVVAAVRRALSDKRIRVGHAGTLDPFATGLMVVLVGRCTRTAQYFSGLDKRYETLAQLGALSTTGDPEGEITVTGKVPGSPLSLPTGEITQVPPAYSAIKIGGVRAYKLARAGKDVDVPERRVTIHAFEELARDGDRVRLAVHCSSGTYIRSLVTELGDGYCLELRRTAIGRLRIDDAVLLATLAARSDVAGRLLAPEHALDGVLPAVRLTPEQSQSIVHGKRLDAGELGIAPEPGRPLMLLDEAGIVAIGEAHGARIGPVVGLRA